MLREADKYTYRVMRSDEDNEYIGLCAEFPGLSWLAASPEEALKGIRATVRKCVKDLAKTGEPVPQALTTKKYSGKFMVRVPPEVHRQLAVKAAANGKKITLEMGGKSPFIVLADANVDFAVDTAAFGIFLHQGQICMAGTRIIVEAPVYDEFCRKFAKKAAALKVGDPKDPTTVIGPLISASKCAGVDALVQAAIKQGARVVAGGKYDGPYYEPTVVIDVDNSMKIFYEECFAPVVVVCKARDHLEALALANDNEYGLSSAVMTNDMDKMMFFAQNLETGMTHFNHTTVYDEPHVPFGGVKNSGFGREGGHYSMEEMTEVKWITISGSTPHPYPF